MFESLSRRIEGAIKSLSGQGRISELNISESMGEIRRALLEADVNYRVARTFTNRVKEQSLGERVLRSVAPGQLLVKIVHDELVRLLGGTAAQLRFSSDPPTVILVVGLQGSGKTTFCAKLAQHVKSNGKVPLLAAADVYRPAAVEQLTRLASEIQVPVHSLQDPTEQDALKVATESVKLARKEARDVVIIDTAGRLHVDSTMMSEVSTIKEQVRPTETLFVVDSMIGQDAVKAARAFSEQVDFDGVVLTKLDGDTRGGAALSIRSVVEKPIKFASTGEKLGQLTPFYPDRMARRILGMGDVVTLVEQAQAQFDTEQAATLRRKIQRQTLNLEDFYKQLQNLKAMGPLAETMKMIPGANRLMENTDEDEAGFQHIEAMILSMTPQERRNPHIINAGRRRRIAAGSGKMVRDVSQLLREFRTVRKLMKRMATKGHRRRMPMQPVGGR